MVFVPRTPCGRGIEIPLRENQGVTSLEVSGTFLTADDVQHQWGVGVLFASAGPATPQRTGDARPREASFFRHCPGRPRLG
jgi:hypothetical protein